MITTGIRASRILVLGLCLILGTRAAGQLQDWSATAASPGDTVKLEESLAYVVSGNRVTAYSAISRTWATMFSAAAPVISLTNESFLVKDGPVFWGYSPHTGVFTPQLTFSPSAGFLVGASPQTWHNVVVDGNDVHVYFSFSGQWRTFSFVSPPVVSIGRFCVLFDDGQQVQAVSSYSESAVALAASGASILGTYGNVGLAYSPGMVYGFSAARNSWSKMAVTSQPNVSTGNIQNGFVGLDDGTSFSFFSGHTGSFVTLSAPPTATRYLQREVAVVVDGTNVYSYSGLKGTISSMTASVAATIHLDQYQAIIADPGFGLTAYSALRGEYSAPLVGSFQVTTTANMTTATPSGWTTPSDVYSAITNNWVTVPAGVGMAAPTWATACSVIIEDPMGGLWGLSGRGSNWIYEPFSSNPTVHVGFNPPATAGTFLAYDGSSMTAFNPRTETWSQTTTAAAPAYVRGHATAIVVLDGVNAYAYSNLTNRWAQTPVGATALSQGAQVHSGFVFDGTQVHAYSGVGQVSTIGEFPDHWRTVTQGQRFRVEFAAEPGAESFLLYSIYPSITPTPWGSLYLDPNSLMILTHFYMPASGVSPFTFQVPFLPLGIASWPVHFQGVVVGPMGTYLTEAATFILI